MIGVSDMYIAVCDDNAPCVDILEKYFDKLQSKHKELKWKCFRSAEDVLGFYGNNGNKFDVLITDIEMEGMSGVELANNIRNRDEGVIIFFLTGHSEYAPECFYSEPMNFWLKPVSFETVKSDLNRARKRIARKGEYISVIENRREYNVPCDDIIYVEKWGRKIIIHVKYGEYRINKSLADLQRELDTVKFIRVNQTFIVNMAYVRSLTKDEITLKDISGTIPIGRVYADSVKRGFIKYKERSLTEL